MKRFSLLILASCMMGVSCERHEFDGPNGTKQLNEEHHAGGAKEVPAGGHEKPSH